jgi:Flp pilus assembly pilin Flp
LASAVPYVYDFLKTSLGIEIDPVTDFGDLSPVSLKRGVVKTNSKEMEPVANFLQKLWNDESGQDIAEYAVMLAVILVIVVGTIRLIGSNANNVFSNVGSAIGQ